MTKITFDRSGEDYRSFTFAGHADYAKKGDDIVCAALSALVINTINSLEALCGTKPEVFSDEKRGELICRFSSPPGEKERLLLDSLLFGARGIEQEYGKKFCTVTVREV